MKNKIKIKMYCTSVLMDLHGFQLTQQPSAQVKHASQSLTLFPTDQRTIHLQIIILDEDKNSL